MDQKFIDEEIQKLLKDKIIEPSQSPWRAQVLVTSSEHHKKRMVIDYSQTINRFTLLDAYPLPSIEDVIAKVSKHKIFSKIDLKSAYHQVPILESEKSYTAFEAGGNLYQFRRIPFGVTNGVAAFQRAINNIIKSEQLEGVYAYLDDITICGINQTDHDEKLKKFEEISTKYNLTLNVTKSEFSKTTINLLGYNICNGVIKPDPERLRPLLELPIPTDSVSLRRALGMFAHYAKWIPKFSYKIQPFVNHNTFPLTEDAIKAFEDLKIEIAKSTVAAIESGIQMTVETDASDYAIAATLSQEGRPVAFFSRTLSATERGHPAIEKEASAIVESLRKWRQLLIGRTFKLITDQRSISFMFNQQHTSKIKNEKIQRWRLELSSYNFDIIYRPGRENVVADALSRANTVIASTSRNSLMDLHNSLCHPGITRMVHWVRTKNLPFSVEEIKRINTLCPVCAEIKPRFIKSSGTLIKATTPFERISMDFKGPLPSRTQNKYILTVVDEYSRFPFAFPCPDLTAETVKRKLTQLFAIFGVPTFVHSDRGTSFVSSELKEFLCSLGVATSYSSPYNPQGNGQTERYNGIIWKTIQLSLMSLKLPISAWESVITQTLHCIRSLLCTSTGCTPHERMFSHPRRSSNGQSMPTWLTEGSTVFMKNLVRKSKYDPFVEEVEVLNVNPHYSQVRLQNGRETTISNRYLAPANPPLLNEPVREQNPNAETESFNTDQSTADQFLTDQSPAEESPTNQSLTDQFPALPSPAEANISSRRSTRLRRPPNRFQDYQTDF
ncbi:uncharacterized protein LOC131841533 [Achroia grisella]|uniref:uncharacterized protein LOC131841526 n=1 Tax=Achroia grisella TaxID=688607 RepID=UPI0027D224A4|nr:uncharacterized protein LOC131841526 [Achroia grisella]XP_059045831.1 uncharacterized protein LOC131841533 [Achroia grisella]